MRMQDGWLVRTPREELARARLELAAQERLAKASTKAAHKAHHTANVCEWRLRVEVLERAA